VTTAARRRDKQKRSVRKPAGFNQKPDGDGILKNVKNGSISYAAIMLRSINGSVRRMPINSDDLWYYKFLGFHISSFLHFLSFFRSYHSSIYIIPPLFVYGALFNLSF